jgi:hypothetical protein
MPEAPANRAAALALLGLGSDATRAQIITAYRRLARVSHPDRCSDPDAAERFAALTAAYRYAIRTAKEHDARVTQAVPPARRVAPVRGHAQTPPLVAGPVRFVPWAPTDPSNRREL